MGNLRNKVSGVKARTRTEQVFKEALLSMLPEQEEVEQKIDLDDVGSNNKDVLVAYAEQEGIEAADPKNKADYVEAIENHLSQ